MVNDNTHDIYETVQGGLESKSHKRGQNYTSTRRMADSCAAPEMQPSVPRPLLTPLKYVPRLASLFQKDPTAVLVLNLTFNPTVYLKFSSKVTKHASTFRNITPN